VAFSLKGESFIHGWRGEYVPLTEERAKLWGFKLLLLDRLAPGPGGSSLITLWQDKKKRGKRKKERFGRK